MLMKFILIYLICFTYLEIHINAKCIAKKENKDVVYVKEGVSLVLSCVPPDTKTRVGRKITWTKGIADKEPVRGNKDGMIEFQQSKLADTGLYECIVDDSQECFAYELLVYQNPTQMLKAKDVQVELKRCVAKKAEKISSTIHNIVCDKSTLKGGKMCPYTVSGTCSENAFIVSISQEPVPSTKKGCDDKCMEGEAQILFGKTMTHLDSALENEKPKKLKKLGSKLLKEAKHTKGCHPGFSMTKDSRCIPCDPGYFSNDGFACKPCPKDYDIGLYGSFTCGNQKKSPKKGSSKLAKLEESKASTNSIDTVKSKLLKADRVIICIVMFSTILLVLFVCTAALFFTVRSATRSKDEKEKVSKVSRVSIISNDNEVTSGSAQKLLKNFSSNYLRPNPDETIIEDLTYPHANPYFERKLQEQNGYNPITDHVPTTRSVLMGRDGRAPQQYGSADPLYSVPLEEPIYDQPW